jgi:hypothetical protein
MGAITIDMACVSAVVASPVCRGFGAFKRHVTNLSAVEALASMCHLLFRVGTVLSMVAYFATVETGQTFSLRRRGNKIIVIVTRWFAHHLRRRRAKQSNLAARDFESTRLYRLHAVVGGGRASAADNSRHGTKSPLALDAFRKASVHHGNGMA